MRTGIRGGRRLGWVAAAAVGGAGALAAALLQPTGAGAIARPAAQPAARRVGPVADRAVRAADGVHPATAARTRAGAAVATAGIVRGSATVRAAAVTTPPNATGFTALGTTGLLVRAGAASWAPDGSRFAASFTRRGGTSVGSWHADGTHGVTVVNANPAVLREVAWSRYGSLVAVATSSGGVA